MGTFFRIRAALLASAPSSFPFPAPPPSPQVRKSGDGKALIKLPSGEQRLVLDTCMATIGSLGNKVGELFARSSPFAARRG